MRQQRQPFTHSGTTTLDSIISENSTLCVQIEVQQFTDASLGHPIPWLRLSDLLRVLTHLPEGAHSRADWRPRGKLLSWCCETVLHPRPWSNPEKLQLWGSPDSLLLEPDQVDRCSKKSAALKYRQNSPIQIWVRTDTSYVRSCVFAPKIELVKPYNCTTDTNN